MGKNEGEASRGIGAFSRGPPPRYMGIEEYAVDWDGPSTSPPRLRLLLLADVDLPSAGRIVEWAIQCGKAFDLCAVCGDFVPRPEGWSGDGETEEQLSAEEGEMSATLAQLENTVCRVVYVPGPLDPVVPSIRNRRTRSPVVGLTSGATQSSPAAPAAAAERCPDEGRDSEPRQWNDTTEGVLQLTPTSKNLFRRNLRLSPGLSAAGFADDPNQPPGSTTGDNSSNDEVVGGGSPPHDLTFAALRSLSLSGSSKSKGRRKVVPESVILLTRLGGARRQSGSRERDTAASAATKSAVRKDAAAVDSEDAVAPVSNKPEVLSKTAGEPATASSAAATDAGSTERAEAATTALLRRLWAQQTELGGATGGSGLLLHVCAGPGTFPAVREALAAGARRQGGGSFPTAEDEGFGEEKQGGGIAGGDTVEGVRDEKAYDDERTGFGCRIGGCTVAALGSLREHGAYCVVELGLPTTATNMTGGGVEGRGEWSVASVQFGRVDSFGEQQEAERELLTRGTSGNYVLNFD